MNIKTFLKDTRKISKITTFIIFLALIRCISEPFRLQYYAETPLTFVEIKPFLIGAVVAVLGLLIMTILFYFNKYRMVIATCALTIIGLVIVKQVYLLP
jgi:hypothetical protein